MADNLTDVMRLAIVGVCVLTLGVGIVWRYMHSVYCVTCRTADRCRQIEAQMANMFELHNRAVAFFKAQYTAAELKKAVYVEAERQPKKRRHQPTLLDNEED